MNSRRLVALLLLALGSLGLVTVLRIQSTSAARREGLPLPAAPSVRVGDPAGFGDREGGDPKLEPPTPQRAALAADVTGPAPGAAEGARAASRQPPGKATPEELAEFRDYVDATLAELRREEAADSLRDIARRTARMDRTIHVLEQRLGLTPLQSGQLYSALLLQLDREAEYVWQAQQGADEEILGELKVSDRAAHRRELSQFLTYDQLQAYLSQGVAGGR